MQINDFWKRLPLLDGKKVARMSPTGPITALAPMQDVTTLPFMQVLAQYGAPDLFFTEYFRVHSHSSLETHILNSITQNKTGRPVFAQVIGESLPDLERSIEELHRHPIAGIDLNMGCPAPRVYKKNVGGGLLRELDKVNKLLAHLRAVIPGLFTVKMRVGFEDSSMFADLLASVASNRVDLLSVHGRTVKELYRSDVHYDLIARAVQTVPCPVLANGNVSSAQKAQWVLNNTQASGIMIGRAAIRNPWIFRQCQEAFEGKPVFQATLEDVYGYIEALHDALLNPEVPEFAQVSRLKKFLNFVGQSIDSEGAFLYAMRRAQSLKDLFLVAQNFLLTRPKDPFPFEAYPNVIARPNCESPISACG